MVMLVKLLGIVIVVLGVVFFVNPKAIKQYIGFWMKGKRIYAGGVLSLLFSVVFLLAASQCRLAWFIVIMGILSLIKGIVLLALRPEKLKPLYDWWLARTDTFLRLYSVFAIAIGILLIYSV